MAEKKIEIRIAATGGDQAAAEVRKVEQAATDAAQATQGTRGFGGMLDGTVPRLDETAEAMENVAEKAGEMTAALPDLTESEMVAEGLKKLGGGAETAAAGAGKAAGGLGGLGANALRLAGGPLGVLSLAVGFAAKKFLEWHNGIQQTIARLAEENAVIDQATRSIRDQAVAVERAAILKADAAERARDYSDAMQRLEAVAAGYNKTLRDQLGLLQEQQQAENEIARAKGEVELAAAGDDPVKKAEIRDRLRREEQARELKALADTQAKKQQLLNEQERTAPDVEAAGEAEAQALRDQAAAAAEQARKLRDTETRSRALQKTADMRMDTPGISMDDWRASLKTRESARRKADAAGPEAERLEAEAKDLEAQASTTAAEAKKQVDAILAEMNSLYQEIQRLGREQETKQAVFSERDKAGDITLDATREQARKRQEQEEKRKADAAARKEETERRKAEAEENSLTTRQARAGRDAVSALPKNVSEKFRAAVEAASAGLQDGDQGGEIEKLVGYMEQLAAATSRNRTVSEAQRIKIEQLQKRISEL
jgi:hypothetical protein